MKNEMIVIETPAGSREKYNYDPETGFFFLKKILPAGMQFPFDFGFIPGTKGEDGDPLDAVVVSECKTYPGCMMECRIIGCLQAEQQLRRGRKKKIRNDRFITVPVASAMYKRLKNIKHIPAKVLEQLQDFFIQYNKEEGKVFTVTTTSNASAAVQLVKRFKIT